MAFFINFARASGKAVRSVVCEHCGTAYSYVISRTMGDANLTAAVPFPSALESAAISARTALEQSLRTNIEPVPCLSCGQYQQEMLELAIVHERLNFMPWLRRLGIGLILLGIVLFGVAGLLLASIFFEISIALLLSSFVAIGAGIFGLIQRVELMKERDPNDEARLKDRRDEGMRRNREAAEFIKRAAGLNKV